MSGNVVIFIDDVLIVEDARREGDLAKYKESCDLHKRVERQMTTPTSDDDSNVICTSLIPTSLNHT